MITPVDVLSVKPAGSPGATEYEATAPPDDVGVFAVIAVPVTYDAGLVEYARFDGGASAAVTVMEREAVVEPAAFVAVTI
jgi:hypothetical protein